MPRHTGPATPITVERLTPYPRGASSEPDASATATDSMDTTMGGSARMDNNGADLIDLNDTLRPDKPPHLAAQPDAANSVAHLNATEPVKESHRLFWKRECQLQHDELGAPSVPWAEMPPFQDETSLINIPPGVSRFLLSPKFDLRDLELRGRAIITARRCLVEFIRRMSGGKTLSESAADSNVAGDETSMNVASSGTNNADHAGAMFHIHGIGKSRLLDISTPHDPTLLLEPMPLAFDGRAASYVGRGPGCLAHHATVRIMGLAATTDLSAFMTRLCDALAPHGTPREAWSVDFCDPLAREDPAVFSGEIRVLVTLEENGAPSPTPRDSAFLMPGFMRWDGEDLQLDYRGRRQHCDCCKSRADPHHERDKCMQGGRT